MKVVVDTSVWSFTTLIVNLLRDLITDGRVALLEAVRQEVLSGIRHTEQFTQLRDYLRTFSDLELTTEDYELAAEFYNTCRRNGIQGANTDFLPCAVAHRRSYSILTTDRDFESFQAFIPLILLN